MRQTGSAARSAFELAVHVTTLGGALALAMVAFTDIEKFQELTAKDSGEGAGLVENLTVLVLLPGIAAAFYGLARYRSRLPVKWLTYWLLMWTLAVIYFAGEEISWGQWYFGWETPEALAKLNNQNETNLHNISSWLDQKPRAMVELFIVFAGLVVPLMLTLMRSPKMKRSDALSWIVAPSLCWSAALVFLVYRVCGMANVEPYQRLDDSEVLELAVAWFLGLYLLSYPLRLASHPASVRK